MLVVTIEIYPFGNESNKRTLSKVIIGNTGDDPGHPEYGSYIVTLANPASDNYQIDPLLETKIFAFHRDRGHKALVHEALLELEMVE